MKLISIALLLCSNANFAYSLANGETNITGSLDGKRIILAGSVINPNEVFCGANYSYDAKNPNEFTLELGFDGLNNQYKEFFNVQVEVSSSYGTILMNGRKEKSRLKIRPDSGHYLNIRAILTPKEGGIYQDNVIRKGSKIFNISTIQYGSSVTISRTGEMTGVCYFKNSSNDAAFGQTGKGQITFNLINDISLDTTCNLLSSGEWSIRLEDILLVNLKNNEKVYGGDFSIKLNCPNNATVKAAYIGYSDSIDPSNTGQILSTDQGISGAAQNVGLKLYDQAMSNTPITYGPVPSSQFITITDNIAKFADVRAGQNYTKTYKVYYVKSGGTPTAGSVTGRLKYNLYYR